MVCDSQHSCLCTPVASWSACIPPHLQRRRRRGAATICGLEVATSSEALCGAAVWYCKGWQATAAALLPCNGVWAWRISFQAGAAAGRRQPVGGDPPKRSPPVTNAFLTSHTSTHVGAPCLCRPFARGKSPGALAAVPPGLAKPQTSWLAPEDADHLGPGWRAARRGADGGGGRQQLRWGAASSRGQRRPQHHQQCP